MRAPFVAIAACAALALTGCAGEAAPAPTTAASSEPVETPTPTATPVIETFTMPSTCRTALPPSRLSAFIDEELVLLGGPEGRYGDDYLLDRSPEQVAGGITCIWGDSNTEISTVTVSVAPLNASKRAAIVDDLINQGLNEDTDASGSVFWQQGDTDHSPAIVNVLRNDSWISVIQTIGGPSSYAEAELIAGEVHETVYVVG